MRWTAVLLLATLLAAAAPTRGDGVATLWLDSVVGGGGRGGTLRFSFVVPPRHEVRDLSAATVTVKIADDEPTLYAPGTKGYRADVSGLTSRFKAPKRTKPRLARFVLRPGDGTFVAKLRDARLDVRSAPIVELSFDGRVFRSRPYSPPPGGAYGGGGVPVPGGSDGGGGGGPPASLPNGPVAFTSLVRNAYVLNAPIGSGVLRSSGELASYLSAVSGSPAGLGPVDFSKEMIVVVVGDPIGTGYAPWSVRLRTITSSAAGLSVWYDKPYGPTMGEVGAGPANQPAFSAWFHFVKVPATTASVSFNATVYYTQTPWD